MQDLLLFLFDRYREENPTPMAVRDFVSYARRFLYEHQPSQVQLSVPGTGIHFADGTVVSLCIPREVDTQAEVGAINVMGPGGGAGRLPDEFSMDLMKR